MKPQLKREVAVDGYVKSVGMIYFYASSDAAAEFSEFGSLHKDEHSEKYTLLIDRRFDFDEVLAYIQNYDAAA